MLFFSSAAYVCMFLFPCALCQTVCSFCTIYTSAPAILYASISWTTNASKAFSFSVLSADSWAKSVPTVKSEKRNKLEKRYFIKVAFLKYKQIKKPSECPASIIRLTMN